MQITLKDGSVKEFDGGKKITEIAKSISEGLARAAVAAKVDGRITDLRQYIDFDCTIEILTLKDEEGKNVYRHTCSHILAQAVKSVYPTCKLAIGPAVSNGFYYDFEFRTPITYADLNKIETEMSKIIKADIAIEKFTLNKKEALKLFTGQPYKKELIEDMAADTVLSFYKQGDFTDLCSGPHLLSTGGIKAFKLTSVAGAYWRGNEKNKMLTRIYGTAFDKKSDLDAYLAAVEESKKRDHNKLGRELEIFMTDENIGSGLPLFMPNGAKIMQILQR
ncbi:MAG: TGS domain-containing protein, partial [Clostridia bacterium]|nr:TGS domain-containing protein [Clostridia bacterium]